MRHFLYIFISIVFYCNSPLHAQEAKWNEVIVEGNVQTAFDRTIDFLIEEDFFIEGADKESGFIKAKRYVKNRKIISFKNGHILTISLILRTEEPENTKIQMQMYVKEQYRSDDAGANYKDIGLNKKKEEYTAFLKQLSAYIMKNH